MTNVAEPTRVRAGDTVAWTRDDLTDLYPAPTWTLSYHLRNAKGSIEITAAASGEAFAVSEAADKTAQWGPGSYDWIARVTDGTTIQTIDTGRMGVDPDLAQAGAFDAREHPRIVLENIEAVIEKRATKDQSSYTIGSRSLARMPMADLLALRTKYQGEVARLDKEERLAKGLNAGTKVVTRFIGA